MFIHLKNSQLFSFGNHIIPQTRSDFWVKLRHENTLRMRKFLLPMRMKTDFLLILFYDFFFIIIKTKNDFCKTKRINVIIY